MSRETEIPAEFWREAKTLIERINDKIDRGRPASTDIENKRDR